MFFEKEYQNLDFIVTGASGTIGSQVLYELVKLAMDRKINGRIIVLNRSNRTKSATQRIANLFCPQLIPDFLKGYSLSQMFEHIEVFNCDLKNLNIVGSLLRQSSRKAILIHLASSVNLSSEKSQELDTYYSNYLPTVKLLKIFTPILEKFVFISTAFVSGHREGIIENELLNTPVEECDFRNYYEKYKAITEKKVVEICETNKIQWQILRPSVVCGRLLDKPFYTISRFQVFYLFAYFFSKLVNNGKQVNKIRIAINPEAGLNVVPVDFVSKTIIRAVNSDLNELNIVSRNNIPVTFIMKRIFKVLGFRHYEFVDTIPDDLSSLEKLYYRKVGSQFHDYMNTSDHSFDVSQLREVVTDIPASSVMALFDNLISFAVKHEFRNISENVNFIHDQLAQTQLTYQASA